jgi:hypothetical protein
VDVDKCGEIAAPMSPSGRGIESLLAVRRIRMWTIPNRMEAPAARIIQRECRRKSADMSCHVMMFSRRKAKAVFRDSNGTT